MNLLESKKWIADKWFSYLQLQICDQFEKLESRLSRHPVKFKLRNWNKKNINEGGGLSYLMKNGKIFEKVGINKSTVSGVFEKKFRLNIPGAKKDGKYWASGLSVVAHMQNPKIPALHFNTRFIVTQQNWFGGGMDVTPCINDLKEKDIFHKKLKEVCKNNRKNYNKYKNACDKYFYLPHRNEARGIGGIFFDYEKKNWEKNFKFIRDLGFTFMDISKLIILKKIKTKWTKKDKEKQLYKRGRYVEFNLLNDRGTKFGLNSGGNIESIFMSLPPEAKWK